MKIALSVFGLALASVAMALGGPVEIEMAGPGSVQLDWEAVPEKTYQVMATPDLVLPSWTNLTPAGVSFSNVIASSTVPVGAGKQFYRIARPDLDPPEVAAMVPASNAVAVATNAAVRITLSDATGIHTQSLVLTIAGWTNMGHASPHISWTNDTVIFTPPAALGVPGATISNSLTIADTLGHTLSNYTWTFELERTPEVAGEFLSLTAPSTGKRTASGRLRTLPNVRPKEGSPPLHIETVTSNTVVFSYEGTPPTISNGTRLVSFDAAYPFYRTVISNSVDAGLLRITAWTEDISLTNLLTSGSFAAVQFTPADPGLSVRGIGADVNLLHAEFGDDLGGTILYEHPNLKLWLPECSWQLTADVDVAAAIGWGGLESFDASARSELTIHIKPEALFYAAVDGGDEFPLVQPISKVFGGMIGPVPVWIEVIVELNAGYEYEASVAGNAHTVVDMGKELEFSVQLRRNQWTYSVENPPIVLEAEPITWQIEGNAHAKVYVQPKLTVLAYSLAGLWADVVPYTELEGWFQLNPLQYDWALYFGLSSTLGIESRIWDDNWGEKPEWTLYDDRWPLWSTNYPSASVAPVFAAAFPNRTVQVGKNLKLSGWASGTPDPQYKWYYNGSRIVGATAPEYTIASAQRNHAGTYAVQAYNDAGSVQTSCTVAVTSGTTSTFCVTFNRTNGFTMEEATSNTIIAAVANGIAPYSYVWSSTLFGGYYRTDANAFTILETAPRGSYAVELVATDSSSPAKITTNIVNFSVLPVPYYMVIDLSDGPTASNYLVTYLSDMPAGGWTDEYKTNKLVMRRIFVETFTMGSPSGELGRYSDEPQHAVTLTKDFYIGVFEVTQKQWERVMGNWPSAFSNASYRDSRPVECVSYYDIRENPANSAISPHWPQSDQVHADSFMGKLRAKTGQAFDLPTEAQWEYACRAGTTTALNSGYNLTNELADSRMAEVGRYWYNGGSGYSSGGGTSVGTAMAGSYLPNAWGLYDMHGNVLEWCLDWLNAYPGAVSDPPGAISGSNRVARGGGWLFRAEICRSAFRNLYDGSPSYRDSYFGFRPCVVGSIPPGADMVLIPGGTNAGTDPDFGAYSLTVTSFYLDKYEVTKALWDEVYAWAIAHGYSFDNAGSGKAANHPVHSVSWYDCVKWCNARSQKEGRQPVYTVNGDVYKGGRSNDVVQTSVAGYRLPTDVEWEYAARGGATSRRFPWGDSDEIQHARANYYSDISYSYDTSTTRGYHPTYNDGNYPYTSPGGSFAANGYGLHDMAGNVWEWCFDWYPGYEGSNRVLRGSGWYGSADFCGVGARGSGYPDGSGIDYGFGFRAVLPPGQQ